MSDEVTPHTNKHKPMIYYAVIGEQILHILFDLKNIIDKDQYNLVKIILIATNETRQHAEKLKETIKKELIDDIEIKIEITSPIKIGDIIKQLNDTLNNSSIENIKKNKIKYIANITGGTKIMSIALHSFASIIPSSEIRYIYKDLITNNMEIITLPHNNIKEILEIRLLYDYKRKKFTKKYKILELINKNNGLKEKEIAHLTNINIKNIYTKYVKKLEEMDLIIRDKNKRLYITQKGKYYFYLINLYISIETK